MHWSSAYAGFGRGSLDRDVAEIECLVKHLSSTNTSNIVIMGHSTGCQDFAHYLSTKSTPQVIGGILQAPISDREENERGKDKYSLEVMRLLPEAKRLVDEGKGETVLDFKMWGRIEMSAYRLYSPAGVGWVKPCVAKASGEDDYFSHDLPDQADGIHRHPLEESFGRFSAPVLALYSEKDEHVPPPSPGKAWDQEGLMHRWKKHAKHGLEWRIIKNASHAVEEPETKKEMLEHVVRWLGTLT